MSTLDNPIMEEENATPGSVALRYGLIGGLVLVAIGLVTQITGMVDLSNPQSTTNRIINFFNYAVMIAIIVLAVKAYKEGNSGFASFGRAFRVGFLTMLIIAGITLVWVLLYFGVIDTTMIDTIVEGAKEQMMEQQGMDEEQADQAMGFMGWMFNPVGMAITAAVSTVFMGAIFSLIVAAIMKKNPPEETVM